MLNGAIPRELPAMAAVAAAVLLGAPAAAQDFEPAIDEAERRTDCQGCEPSAVLLSDEPRVFHTQEQTFRVVPLKGLVRPWSLAFLPNGDLLITEHGGRLRIVRDGVLDPEPLAGLPDVFTGAARG